MKKENTAIRLISFQKVYFHDFLSQILSQRWYKKFNFFCKNLLTIRYEYDIIISSRRDKNQGGK